MLEVEIRKPLDHFDLDVRFEMKSELAVIFGRSGAGKTQTLECIAGLSRPVEGLIRLGRRVLYRGEPEKRSIDMPSRLRKVGYVFQDGLLFPHMTLRQNVLYPLMRCGRAHDGEARAEALLRDLGIGHLADYMPGRVSGGQRRRAAIARALAGEPELLLMDEPFVHLDRVVKARLMAEVERIPNERGTPVLLVTHDLSVLTRLAARIIVLEQGQVVQAGPRDAVLGAPAGAQVARLFGDAFSYEGPV